jgi:hypothetical protein
MQFSKNTSMGKRQNFLSPLIKILLIFSVIFIAIMLLNKIDFPSPNKVIEKVIPNENLKIVK